MIRYAHIGSWSRAVRRLYTQSPGFPLCDHDEKKRICIEVLGRSSLFDHPGGAIWPDENVKGGLAREPKRENATLFSW